MDCKENRITLGGLSLLNVVAGEDGKDGRNEDPVAIGRDERAIVVLEGLAMPCDV